MNRLAERAQLMRARVMHRRLRPRSHCFVYPTYFMVLPALAPAGSGAPSFSLCQSALFSHNRWNLFSLHDADYGMRDGSDPVCWVRDLLAAGGLSRADGAIYLQTLPRVLGYAFNPVSFWYCQDRTGQLQAVIVEVNNTFGERHAYVLGHRNDEPIRSGQFLAAIKQFHVSPFCTVTGSYRFRFHLEESSIRVAIDYADAEGDLLHTSLAGHSAGWGGAAFLAAVARSPFMALAIVVRIHWQALRLWARGVRFHRKPRPPAIPVTRSS